MLALIVVKKKKALGLLIVSLLVIFPLVSLLIVCFPVSNPVEALGFLR